MKTLYASLIFTLLIFIGLPTAHADTTPEHVRGTVTRSSDTPERTDRGRTDEETDDLNTDLPEDGDGTVLNVAYDDQTGNLVITFESTGSPANANINVTINGDVFTNSGGQSSNSGNTSQDGTPGTDGADGGSDETEEDEEEVVEDDEDTTPEDREGRDDRAQTSRR